MEIETKYDYLSFTKSKTITKLIDKEKLLFSDKILKINKKNNWQERNIVITDKALYNFKAKTLKRRIAICQLIGMTISVITDEFVIHGGETEYDYDYVSQKRKAIMEVLNQVFTDLTGNKLQVNEICDKTLKEYVTLKKEKKNDPVFTRMKNDNLRNAESLLFKDEELAEFNGINEKNTRTETVFSRHKKVKHVNLQDFKIIKVIGRGSFGKVCLVSYLPTKETFAMKSLKKDVLIQQEQIENTLLEKEILQTIDHPLLCSLIFCFQTMERIYFVMPFLAGGELFQHLRKQRIFDEEKVRFYGAQIALGLQYLHDKGIIYRDIKPENILMDEFGYLKLADFGMAKKLKKDEKATSFCGTPEYLAPEIILGTGHNHAADWWSFGILVYEMLCGIPPFYMNNIERMYEMIVQNPLHFKKKIKLTADVQDFVTKLLEKDPKKRLGTTKGLDEIKSHPFFAVLDFNLIFNKKLPAPFVPTLSEGLDVSNFDQDFVNEPLVPSVIPRPNLQMIQKNQAKFDNFSK